MHRSASSAKIVIAPVIHRCGLVLALALLTACKDAPRAARATVATTPSGAPKVVDSPTAAIDLKSAPYVATAMTAMGSVSGSIRAGDSVATDTASTDTDSATAVQDSLTSSAPEVPDCVQKPVTPKTAKSRPFAGSIVWIAGIKGGKPMPVEKRADLSSERCDLDPRVQAVVVGTTMNIINDEKVLHKLVFKKLGARDTLTVTPFFNVGQMVASERLAKTPGIVEVRCTRHPWTRAYIGVFDQPYFAATERNGKFKIDSLPPGSYTLMVWTPGDAKPVERQIQITAGADSRVDFK